MTIEELIKKLRTSEQKEFIKELEKLDPTLITSRDEKFNCSLLDYAAIDNKTEVLNFLCENYPKLLDEVVNVRSPLHYAARHGSKESLLILLTLSKNINQLDHNQQTPIELAIQYKHFDCVKELINHGCILPNDLSNLLQGFSIFNHTLYCEPNGIFKIVDKEDLKELETREQLETLAITTDRKRWRKKPYQMSVSPKDIDLILMNLVDKYLFYAKRKHKETRESLHGAEHAHILQKVNLSRAKRFSLLQIIRIIVTSTQNHDINADYLIHDSELAEKTLQQFLDNRQNSNERYYGDDLSDDSDSEDEQEYLTYLENKNDNNKLEKKNEEKDFTTVKKFQTNEFWLKTKMDTPQNAGLKKKITEAAANIQRGMKKQNQLDNLKPVINKTLNSNLQDRGKINYNETEKNSIEETINLINKAPREKKLALIKELGKPIFVLGTRGINYMLDRWNASSRRYHRKIDERQQPQYSEAVLKELPYDYYTDLDPEHDYHLDLETEILLQKEAVRLHQFLQSLNQTKPCLATSKNQKSTYLFNSVGDHLQDHFSNGVDEHLRELSQKRQQNPEFWRTNLKNSFNAGVAIGSRPYHALKYTFGLKDYYPQSMTPRYWNDGTLEYLHVGKIYLSLHPLEEIFSIDGPNHLSIQDRQGRVSLGDQISPEKELSYLGYLPGDRVFHQTIAKFPSFKGPYKNIYQIKYGLSREIYDAFQYLIQVTKPESEERNRIIAILSEWMCAYHEVLLIEIAKEEAIKRGGIVVYVDRDGMLSLEPENGRIFTRGESNIDLRNEIHILRDLRLYLAQQLEKLRPPRMQHGFQEVDSQRVQQLLQNLLQDNNALLHIAEKVKLSKTEEGNVVAKKTTDRLLKIAKSSAVVNGLIQQGFFTTPMFNDMPAQVTRLADLQHLYTDLEITSLLREALENDPNIGIYAPQHPFVQGELGMNSQLWFKDHLKQMFLSDQISIMPIEISQNALDFQAYSNMNGSHWCGIAVRKEKEKYIVEFIDPNFSLVSNIVLSNLSQEELQQINPIYYELVKLVNTVAEAENINVEIIAMKTEQQNSDLDCGAWTVDNLIQRARQQPLRTSDQITGQQLRNDHHQEYHRRLGR